MTRHPQPLDDRNAADVLGTCGALHITDTDALNLAASLRRAGYAITPVHAAQTAEAILIAHSRYDIKRCHCGWAELGKSHPGHQVAMLRQAGLLNEGPPQ